MGRLFDIIQAHIDKQTYPPSQRDVARALGVSPTTLGNWRKPSRLIEEEHLQSIARLTGVPYRTVLEALLFDIGYLRDEGAPGGAPGRARATTEEAG